MSASDWLLFEDRGDKQIYSRIDPHTGEVEFLESWIEDGHIEQARQQKELCELFGTPKDLMPRVVVPPSVLAQSLREGWLEDDVRWKRWANDIDNRRLRVTEGRL